MYDLRVENIHTYVLNAFNSCYARSVQRVSRLRLLLNTRFIS